MPNTAVNYTESEKCSKCKEVMELSVCGAQGLWTCFSCKEFKRMSNWFGRIINKIIS